MTFAGVGGVSLEFADNDVEDYDYEPGSYGARIEVGGSAEADFDVSHLPPPPNEPPPPVPSVGAEVALGVEGEAGGERKKNKKKHRDGEREAEGEDGERRHRRKKKKHREGEGEEGERPRRHRRHRREQQEEGEGGAEVNGVALGVSAAVGAEVDVQSGDLPPSGLQVRYSPNAGHPGDATGHIGGGFGYELRHGEPPAGFGVDIGGHVPRAEFHHDAPAVATEETWSTGTPSMELHGPPSDLDAPRVVADPTGVDVGGPAVEDFYYRASPKVEAPSSHLDVTAVPSYAVDAPSYTVETPSYAVETPSYAVETPSYAVETPSYAVETPEFHPPEAEFHPPEVEFHPPEAEFHPPEAEFHPPETEFHPPQSEFHPPEPEQVMVSGEMTMPPQSVIVSREMAMPPSDIDPVHLNGGAAFQHDVEFAPPNMHASMPMEPGDDQQMYTVNMQGPPMPHAEGHKKPKGGLSRFFKGKQKKGKGAPEPELHVSAPMGVPHDGDVGVGGDVGVSGGVNIGGGPYAPSPIVGSPDSTIRSGVVQQDPWQSNPQLFNPNMDTLDPQAQRPQHMAPAQPMGVHASHPAQRPQHMAPSRPMGVHGSYPMGQATVNQPEQPGAHGGKPGLKARGKKLPSTRPIPVNQARIILLDGEEIEVAVDKKGSGREVLDRVCDHLSIEERDYFGLTYVNRKEQTWFWLDVEKKISKQLKHGEEWLFNFQVKFYPPEPALIQEDITRYQLTLQVRQDVYTGKLPCSWVTQALLGSFLVQSELGDFDPEEHGDFEYLQQLEFVHGQNDQLLHKIAELHKNHKGMTPDQADLKYLETAKRLEQYGYDLHPARDMDDVDIFIGVSFSGVAVYRGPLRISRFAWPKVLRISYRKNFFYLKIRSDCYDDFEAIVGFKLFNNKMAKRLWKIAVEHHTFFRLKEPRFAPKANLIPRFGSRHRYSGRTFFQYRTMSIDRPHPNFDRSLTKRRTASMPMLAGGAGSQYGSMHSLNRPHPRALTLNKVQSVEYLGPTGPRTPNMGARSGSMEFGGGSSLGGSLQNVAASSGNRVLLSSGVSVPARAGRDPRYQPSPQQQHQAYQFPASGGGTPDQMPRFQYHQRTSAADQGSISGSEASASVGVRAGVRLPYAAGGVAMPQAQVRASGGSVGSAEEDLL